MPDIAAHFPLEDALFEQLREKLGDRLMVEDSAALVRNPEPATRLMLAPCGLDFDAATLAPHETGRAVAAASAVQVRPADRPRGSWNG
ncbi:MAG: Tetratricopeptide repeat protein [Sphingomonas bacterium]|uniref:hypothetical protein n=1 Tax=Sphingomonas bacterium TaxID=1895847 RepID=UPI00261CED15|nr:hypothetical protein [Sphingomonas bacterium]MDB5695279.1 Tetratricopeptide repeat protein [Sphingomonas bacterium]